jgi:hypothetical protein
MGSMSASRRNRGRLGVDDPWDDDGFYRYRRFKKRQVTGKSGKRPWRRAIHTIEKRIWRREET